MERMEFTDNLCTGIIELDDQHKELFTWGNALLFSEEIVPHTLNFIDALGFLFKYARYHFLSEEAIMKLYSYDRIDAHMNQHKRLRREVDRLYDRAKKDGWAKGFNAELQYFFSDWYVYHIMEWDKSLAVFVRKTESESISMPKLNDLRKLKEPMDDIDNVTVELLKIKASVIRE